jgi:hypothetical protein
MPPRVRDLPAEARAITVASLNTVARDVAIISRDGGG